MYLQKSKNFTARAHNSPHISCRTYFRTHVWQHRPYSYN